MKGSSKPFNTDNTLEIQRLQLALEWAGIGTWELDTTSNQLFLNLISNALKFRKPDILPVIDITSNIISGTDLPTSVTVTRATDTYYKISITDNGIGFESVCRQDFSVIPAPSWP